MPQRLKMTRWIAAGAIALALCLCTAANGANRGSDGSHAGTRHVSVMGAWAGADEKSFRAVLDEFETASPGTTATYDSAGDAFSDTLLKALAAGKGPDVAVLPTPLLLKRLAARRSLRPLAFARSTIAANYAPVWLRMGSVRSTLYGVVFEASNKSTVWYEVKTFHGADVKAPAT
ncbi:MAG: alpha-glucoside transport system substrate-binding protein, partial [Gaiellaceae bacterium]|nr:alpha-glucoside transport system substrate-binding protein [Gaiellaceae bacterium]